VKTIRRADPDDVLTVHSLIHTAARWLHKRGYDQWPDNSQSLTYARLGEQIRRGETYIVSDGYDPVATIAVSPAGDPDFWTPDELAESAVYCSKAAVVRRGEGIGAIVMRWVIDRAAMQDVQWVRLDAWRTNRELHEYYRGQGWTYLRTVELPHRRSGTLFQKAAAPNPQARAVLTWQEQPNWRELPSMVRRPALDVGTPVLVSTPEGPVAAIITEVIRDWSHDEVSQGWETEVGGPPTRYVVARGDRTWTPQPDQIWPDRIAVLDSSIA
jgi:GNAT superfamily N-acetyltransferase